MYAPDVSAFKNHRLTLYILSDLYQSSFDAMMMVFISMRGALSNVEIQYATPSLLMCQAFFPFYI